MITYNFTNIGSYSLYEYLYKCIKNDIINGNIGVGEKLPSKRTFAKNLGISVITVENAYEQLIAEGYIYSIPKKGFYVTDFKSAFGNVNSSSGKTIKKEQISLTGGKNSYKADFTSNQTVTEIFPFTIWTKVVREVLNDSRIQLMINPPCGGIMELRNAIAEYLKEFRGMSVNPLQIIIGAGTEYLYSLLIQLLGNDKVYAVENPGYLKVGKIYDSMKVKCEYIDIDENGVSVEEMEKKSVDIIHISPSHHFPTGIVMPISRRYELLGWASKEKNRYIIEDDYDSELRLSGKPIPTLQSIDVSDKVIYINTFTKTLASTVRISYMILPSQLMEKFYEKLGFYSCTVSNFEQYTLANFMKNGSFEKHINRLRTYYQNKREVIVDAFCNSRLGKYIEIEGDESGVHFLMHIDSKYSEEEFVRLARAKGINMMPLSGYYIGNDENGNGKNAENYRNTYVMNYSSVDINVIDEVVEALYELIKP